MKQHAGNDSMFSELFNRSKKSTIVSIPPVSCFSKNIVMIYESNENTTLLHDKKVINFTKINLLYDSFEVFIHNKELYFKSSELKFPIVQPLYDYLYHLIISPDYRMK